MMGEYYISRITYEGGIIMFNIKSVNDGTYQKNYTLSVGDNGKPITREE